MTARIELHGSVTGNCLRAAIAFEEAAIPYCVVQVDLEKAEHRSKNYLAFNPAGKVPTLVEHGAGGAQALAQSNAIILYATDLKPGVLLPTDDPRRRAITFERFFYFITDVIAVSHAAFALRAKKGATGAMNFLNQQALDAILGTERFVGESEFMAGSQFTIADIAGYTITHHLQSSIDWRQVPNLKRWFHAVAGRPATQRGLHAFDRPR